MSVSAATVFQRKKQNLPENMKRFLAGAELCAQSGAHEQVLYNLSVVARDALCAGMLAICWENDLKTGASYFAQGADTLIGISASPSKVFPLPPGCRII